MNQITSSMSARTQEAKCAMCNCFSHTSKVKNRSCDRHLEKRQSSDCMQVSIQIGFLKNQNPWTGSTFTLSVIIVSNLKWTDFLWVVV